MKASRRYDAEGQALDQRSLKAAAVTRFDAQIQGLWVGGQPRSAPAHKPHKANKKQQTEADK